MLSWNSFISSVLVWLSNCGRLVEFGPAEAVFAPPYHPYTQMLLASVGAWIGPGQIFLAFVFMGLAGGVMALAWAIKGRFVQESVDGVADLIFGVRKRGFRPHGTLALTNPNARKMPYAPAIAVGVILSFFALP